VIDREFRPNGEKYKGYVPRTLEVSGKVLDDKGLPTVDVNTRVVGFRSFWLDDDRTDVALLTDLGIEEARAVPLGLMPEDILASPQHMASLVVGAAIGIPGYVDGHDVLANRPILRSGIIASDPRFPYAIDG